MATWHVIHQSDSFIWFEVDRTHANRLEKKATENKLLLVGLKHQLKMAHKNIYYSDKYTDDQYEYR